MPVASLPETLSLDSSIAASYYPEVEPQEFRREYKSPWIQTIGSHAILLHEPTLSGRDNPFSLVEETFEKYGWIPSQYVKMTSERFMEKNCWA